MMPIKHNYLALLILLPLFAASTSVFAQCPAPEILVDPLPFCNFPLSLKADGGPYIAYRWSTTETIPQISVTANGTYTVTVTCADNTTATRTTTINYTPPSVRMLRSVIRPCLPGQNVLIQLETNSGFAGNNIFKVLTSNGDTITLDVAINAGLDTISFPANPAAGTTYSIISGVSSTGCNYAIGVPKMTTILPIFESEEQYPTIGGTPYFCKTSSTQLNVIWTDPEPTSYLWVTPGLPQSPLPFYNATQEGTYFVNVRYGTDCLITLSQFVDEKQPVPVIQGNPICSGTSTTLSLTETYVDYQWSTGDASAEVEITEPGNYRVTVTDEFGCTGFAAKTIAQVPSPIVSINGPIVLCTGQTSAQLVATGFNIASYSWSTGATTANLLITGPGDYSVTVTSNNGCTGENFTTVEQVATPTASIPGASFVCAGDTLTLSPVYSTPEAAYQWTGGATTSTIKVTTGGLYRVTVYDPTLSCSSTAFTLVTVVQKPAPNIIASDPTACSGNIIQLNTNYSNTPGFAHLWSNGFSIPTTQTIVAGTYTVTVTEPHGCSGTDTIQLVVFPVPNPSISGPKSLCGRDSVQLTTTLFPHVQWSNGDTTLTTWVKNAGSYSVVVTNVFGCTSAVSFSVANTSAGTLAVNGGNTLCGSDSLTLVANGPFNTFSWSTGVNNDSLLVNAPGTYIVTATDNFGCTASKTTPVTNQGGFSTAVAYAPLCNSTVSLTAESGFTGYAWSSGVLAQVFQAEATGTYTVTVTNAGGCTASASYNVTVLPDAPTPLIAGPAGLCPSASGNLSLTDTYQSYVWSTGSNTATAVAAMPGSYSVTVTDNNGCTGTNEITLGAFSAPSPEIAGSQTICNGATSELSVSSIYTAFEWSNGGTTSAISIGNAGTYTVTVTNVNGCTGTTSLEVIESNILSPSVVIEPYSCNETLTLNAGAGYTTYLWSTGETTATTTITTPGDYGITVTDDAGCIGTSIRTVTAIPSTPLLSIEGPEAFCANSTTTLIAAAGFSTYSWNTGSSNVNIEIDSAGTYSVTATDNNGCTRTSDISVFTNPAPQPSVTVDSYDCNGALTLIADGPYNAYAWDDGSNAQSFTTNNTGTFTVTVTDANGCTGNVNFNVSSIPVAPIIGIAGPASLCTGTTGLLSATPGFASYLWNTGDTTSDITVSEGGTYTVTVTNAENCTGTIEQIIETLESPSPVITSLPYNCDGLITLTAPGFIDYQWSTGANAEVTFADSTGVFSVTVTAENGCTGVATSNIDVPVLPNPQIVETPLPNYIVQLEATPGFTAYIWSNNDTTANTIITETGIYTVTVTDTLGCTATATAEVVLNIAQLTLTSTINEITCANSDDARVEICINGGQPPYTISSTPSVMFQTSTSPQCEELVVFIDIPAGSFEWSVTDANNVTLADSYTFVNPEPIVATASGADSTVIATVTGGVLPYQFSIDGVNYQNSPVFENLNDGAYQVYVLDARGCNVLTNIVIIFTNGTNDVANEWKMQVTPNPGDGNFWLTLENYDADEIQLSIRDVTGKMLQQYTVSTGNTPTFRHGINLTTAGAGTYLIQVRTANGTKTIPVVLMR